MYQSKITTKDPATIGEEIDHELGVKMVKDFRAANPDDNKANYIGRNIIEKILDQPNCVGICFFNGINEMGKKNLVYVGVDENKRLITQFSMVKTSGELVMQDGVVGDRSVPPYEEEGWFFGWFD